MRKEVREPVVGFPGGSRWQRIQEARVQSLGWEDLLEKGMEPALVILPGESRGQRSLAGCSP